MYQEISMTVPPQVAFDSELLKNEISKLINIAPADFEFCKLKQSLDARKRGNIVNHILVAIFSANHVLVDIQYNIKTLPQVDKKPPVIIVGAGPAGLFAALKLIELGLKPIVIERGKNVRERRRDLAAINRNQEVNPESNYCFGEGGAGTYSDGKLYTRSSKRGDILRIMEIFVAHGAPKDILFEAHPHIGTNKLPQIVANLRETILEKGGEVHFNRKVTDFIIEKNQLKGIIDQNNESVLANDLILATGHSARDIFELLHSKNVLIEAKPFALGVRVEHPQSMIDKAQYKITENRPNYLPAASYSLVTQVKHRGVQKGVFSFCMCPGGFIVPSATDGKEIVVNGMSPSRRDSKYANSGLVTNIEEKDWAHLAHYGPLAALEYQKNIEQKAFENTSQSQKAPAQLISDFIIKKQSSELLETSYQPGLTSMKFDEIFPENIAQTIRLGLIEFGNKIKGYASNMGQMIGIESRTSSPVRIPRDRETLEHPVVKGFYPCGEGAGYAGGIVSAAMDGERCAIKIAEKYEVRK